MGKITSRLPRSCPSCDPEEFDKGMERAQELLQKGCDALDEGRFWSGVALGVAGGLQGLGTMLCHPAETIGDLCSPDDKDEPEDVDADDSEAAD